MIELLTGDNDYELTRAVAERRRGFDGQAERYDAAELTGGQLGDIFAGQTLFAMRRLVILDNPSANSELWSNLETWLGRVSDETHLVLVEPKPDKRTAAFKWLQKHADVSTFTAWTPRDRRLAEQWLAAHAKDQGATLDKTQIHHLIDRVGLDQWALHDAISKLSLLDTVTTEQIDDIVPMLPSENVFALLETALDGDSTRTVEMLDTLRKTEDAYRVFGLLTSQVLQLALLTYADGSIKKVAQDTSARPFMLERLVPHAARLGKSQARTIIKRFAESDTRLKSSDADPWTVIETTLLRLRD
ncbi:MAG TPA: DNA polymerase III subunit delta [Candidatus Saccharibacteria bacterium]|nr:DNA polymerase III subunit delta [Candidatus Saccharibacteria bacterium]HRK94101.1 DNA polymerase III subunit delta [Candidatus Saccharibacteria bacterium]